MWLKDKIVKNLLDMAKRHPALKLPVLACIAVVMWVFHFLDAVIKNRGKVCMVGATIVLFILCSSFSPRAKDLEKSETALLVANEAGLDLTDYINAGENPTDTKDIDEFIKKNETEEAADNSADRKDTEQTVSDSDLVIYDESGNLIQPDFSEDWKLILVNKQNQVPEDYQMNLTAINGSMQVDARIAKDLAKMLDAAKGDGVNLMICSAYRSYERQITLFENKIRRSMAKGMSYLDAYADASYSVTVPGTSEHQLGLALDIVTPSYTSLNEGFENTEAGKWLKDNASQYGFILRYPKGKEYITGIIFEPWHYRYVGRQAAEEIMGNDLTLEEYLEQIGMK